MPAPERNILLDLRSSIGQVSSTFRWDLISTDGFNVIGQIHPQTGVSISNDTRSSVFRTARNVLIRESEARDIDVLSTLVKPHMVLEDGTVWPMGMFAFTSDSFTEGTLETPLSTTLMDLRFLLNQPMPHSFGISGHGLVHPAMIEIIEMFGLGQYEVLPSDARIGGDPVNWPPDATALTILESLAQRAGFYAPYFDNNGTLILRPVEEPHLGYGHIYNRTDGRILVDTLNRSTNLLTASNAYKVISSGPTNGEIYAIAYVDAALPHSKERRGFAITKTIRKQGLPDQDACRTVAEAYARQDAAQLATLEFASVIDPRHDTFDLIDIDGEVYREVSWSMEVAPGGTHTHTLVKGILPEDL